MDVNSGFHWAKPGTEVMGWAKYIDTKWLEQAIWLQDLDTRFPLKTPRLPPCNEIGMRSMLRLQKPVQRPAHNVAVILADVQCASWIMESEPFPVVERAPQVGELYHMYKDHVRISMETDAILATRSFEGVILGTFATSASQQRRLGDHPYFSPAARDHTNFTLP